MVRAVVREWDDELGWGVLDSAETPGGCWAHYSAIEAPLICQEGETEVFEYKTVAVGESVELEWEEPGQDGFDYRAVVVSRTTDPRQVRAPQVRQTGHVKKPQDERAVRTAYDEVADAYADHFRTTEPEQPVELAMIDHFASLLARDRRVLDAGCGAGRLLPVLDGLRCNVEGVDLSPGMIHRAQQDHPAFGTQVASLTDLPYPDASFDGYFSWYSTIHSPDEDLPIIIREARRVLRAGGLLLVAFQSGHGTQDVSGAYRDHGHDITLERYQRTANQIVKVLSTTGLHEVARLERQPAGPHERDSQGVVIARR